jgi:hypothetical protein
MLRWPCCLVICSTSSFALWRLIGLAITTCSLCKAERRLLIAFVALMSLGGLGSLGELLGDGRNVWIALRMQLAQAICRMGVLSTQARDRSQTTTMQGCNRPRNSVGRSLDTFLYILAPPGHVVNPHITPFNLWEISNTGVVVWQGSLPTHRMRPASSRHC